MSIIYLRDLTIADAKTSWPWRNDADVWQYTGSRPDRAITEAIETAWLEEALQRPNERRYAICLTDTHEYIGNVQLTHITARGAQVHLFIGVKQYWGSGYGRQAIAALLQLIDHLPESEVLYLQVHPDNTAAIRLYQHAGFVPVGHISSQQLLMERRKPSESNPTLSVFMMSYNHAAFIGQALQGVFDQQVDFPIEIVLGDDASTDDTRAVIFRYYQQRPWLFRLILHDMNIGACFNQMVVFKTCKKTNAKYIAICEGDDYWTDPMKLHKQVSLLESNPQYSLCFHDAWLLLNKSGTMQTYGLFRQDIYKTVDILKTGAFIPSLSIVFRVEGFDFPSWFSRTSIGDIALVLMNSLQGDIILLREKMGVYRKHEKGVSVEMEANQIQLSLESVKLLHYFNLHTQFEYDHIIQEVNKATLYRMKHFVAYQNTSDTRPLRQKLVSPDFWRRKIRELIS
ncbi:MAG: GNAT family N-acetyltransferase [Bacteroidetes bacterium]|uniref:GNAT family N-acetyltransferase n=1 Tax=Phnomibacter sp. TaxID=2836217 RepID=UPI002FDDCB22|nr:GNAT family N-acetyltransferase [Bacteroidota bacterium]